MVFTPYGLIKRDRNMHGFHSEKANHCYFHYSRLAKLGNTENKGFMDKMIFFL